VLAIETKNINRMADTHALDMPVRDLYNMAKAICGMSTRSTPYRDEQPWLKAASGTPAPNVARWKPHRRKRELRIENWELRTSRNRLFSIFHSSFSIPA
jgi:hypothetical protein